MPDEGIDDLPAKRIKIEKEVTTVVLTGSEMEVQTPFGAPQAMKPDQGSAKVEEDATDSVVSSHKDETPSIKPKVVHIDPRGDIDMVAKGSDDEIHTIFVVCSRTLARASPHWSSLLFPLGPNDNQLANQAIDSCCREPDTLEVVLHILHANASKLPASLTASRLRQVLRLGRQYNVMSTLLLWGIKWHSLLVADSAYKVRPVLGLVKGTWCSNELGLTEKFHVGMRNAAMRLQVDNNSDLIAARTFGSARSKLKDHHLQDESCIKLLTDLRSHAIQKQLENVKGVTDSLVSPTAHGTSPISACQNCIYKWIGCIIHHLSAPQPSATDARVNTPPLWPIPQLEAYYWSVEDLRKHLQTVEDKLNSLEKCQGDDIERGVQFEATSVGLGSV